MGPTPAENFLAAFAALKSQVGGKPQNVGWMTKESQHTALLAFFTYFEWRRLEVMLVTSPTKAVARVPTSLKSSYRDYKHDWADAIEKAVNDLLEGDPDLLLKALERSEAVSSDSKNEEEHRPDFDPIRDDPAALIDDMVWLSEVTADEDSELGDQQRKAVQAWDFFRETIGLDLDGVSQRWRRIEPIFMPSHVANAYGLSEPASLNHLLDQAVHAYVFGVPAAALANLLTKRSVI